MEKALRTSSAGAKPETVGNLREKEASRFPAGLYLRRMIRGVDHINIVVADLDRSVTFYTEVLGFTKTKEAHLEGEWIDRIVGLRGVKGRVVFVVPPSGGP